MTTKQPKFTLQETLADNLYLVRRTTDDEILLARPLDSSSSADDAQKVAGLLHPRTTTAHALTNLLNHENLYVDPSRSQPFTCLGSSREQLCSELLPSLPK